MFERQGAAMRAARQDAYVLVGLAVISVGFFVVALVIVFTGSATISPLEVVLLSIGAVGALGSTGGAFISERSARFAALTADRLTEHADRLATMGEQSVRDRFENELADARQQLSDFQEDVEADSDDDDLFIVDENNSSER